MPGLEPGIHVFGASCEKDVDGRVKPAMTSVLSFFANPLATHRSFTIAP